MDRELCLDLCRCAQLRAHLAGAEALRLERAAREAKARYFRELTTCQFLAGGGPSPFDGLEPSTPNSEDIGSSLGVQPAHDLPRFGVNHFPAPGEGPIQPMADGYWTPWHLAKRHEPIAIAERLPQAEHLDALGRCWFSCSYSGGRWNLERRQPALRNSFYTHWLPSWSIVLPARRGSGR